MTLRWPDLPVLSLRIYAARAINSLRLDYAGYLRDDEARAVLERLALLSSAEAPGADEYRSIPPGESANFAFLGEYFSKVGDQLVRREGYRGNASPHAKELLDALGHALGRSPCIGCCKAGSATVCKWTVASRNEDERLLGENPRCLDPVRALFEMANELARDAYQLAGDSETLPFALELDVVKRGGAASSPVVDGETRESALSHRRTVQLRVRASSFEHGEYLMLPYLFAHECIAHGYCGVRLDVDDQYLSTNFQEGWMDEVASLLLNDAFEAGYAVVPGLEAWLGRSEVIEAMNSTRRLRNSFGLRKDGNVALIEEGVAAFKAFCYCMDAARGVAPHMRPSSPTVDEAIEFSMLLNASYLPHELRGSFVHRIASLYDRGSRPSREAALRERPELIAICARYLSSSKKFHDVEMLVRATIALPLE